MSIVKSFSVGNGDMFYIKHASDSFSVIDCCYDSEYDWNCQLDEIKRESSGKSIMRFISTHPDNDHIMGLSEYESQLGISNFYCVKNEATKTDKTDDFETYKELRDSKKAFFLFDGCSRKWLNQSDDEHGSAGINCLWPVTSNIDFQSALKQAKIGNSPNNISPIITYSTGKMKFMWMGDLEADFLEKVKKSISFPQIDILFAPHHGRDSGKIPEDILQKLSPRIVIIGEAPSKNLNYYSNYDTITQNSAGDIVFAVEKNSINIYVGSDTYSTDFLTCGYGDDVCGCRYIGTLSA
jgi:hypothetical protein